jgi:hypothetical protein
MMERKPLPIGIEDFKEVIDSGYYAFVNKKLSHLANKKVSQL